MHPGAALAALAGVTITAAPYVYAFGVDLGVTSGAPSFPGQSWALLAGCLAMMLGGWALNANRVWDQALITAGVASILAALAPAITRSPALALTVILFAGALVFSALESDLPFQVRSRVAIPTRADLAGASARAAAATAVCADLALLLFVGKADSKYSTAGLALAALFCLRWAHTRQATPPRGRRVVIGAAFFSVVWCLLGNPASAHLLLGALALTLIPVPASRGEDGVVGKVMHHPSAPLAASFAALCAVGALLLHAPAASHIEGGVSSIDAVFTSVSAVCVTGLIVLDTPHDFTAVGQVVILLLMQLGALGIMSYSAAIIIALGRRLRLRDESLIAFSLSANDRGQVRSALARLLSFTFSCEAIGAILLAALFYRAGDTFGGALWRGVFTAVSAFCNAGFALQTDSLIPYQTNPWVLHIVAVLIVLGGLSPAAALAVPRLLRDQDRRAQAKLVVVATAVLLIGNFVLIAAFEWNNSLAGLSLLDRLHNAWLQSVTLRTAGFNSVSLDALRPATLLIMLAAMFIGGSPGGTAGGIKTTTAALMLFSITAAIRGDSDITMFGRRVSRASVDRAAAITTLGMLSVFLTVLMLVLTQAMPASHAIFEAVSALGTVGLTIGGTSELDSVGKLIIAAAMFAGRVGPLSLFAFLSTREEQRTPRHPTETIDVG